MKARAEMKGKRNKVYFTTHQKEGNKVICPRSETEVVIKAICHRCEYWNGGGHGDRGNYIGCHYPVPDLFESEG